MKKKLQKVLIVVFMLSLLIISSCASLTFSKKNGPMKGEPTITGWQNDTIFSMEKASWGFDNNKEVCENGEAVQVTHTRNMGHHLLSLITLYIYQPHTVKIWCE